MTETASIEKSKKWQIKYSQELFAEALRTVELPHVAKLEFAADGIERPDQYSEFPDLQGEKAEEIKSYLSQCNDRGIIPFSKLTLEASSFKEQGKIVFGGNANGFPVPDYVMGSLVKGGRFHRIEVKTTYASHFKAFQESVLDALLKGGYQVMEGTLTLTMYHLTGYNEGDYPDTQVTMYSSGRHNGLELRMGSEISAKGEKLLEDWFSGLKAKYDSR
jgi:hypothetical protein